MPRERNHPHKKAIYLHPVSSPTNQFPSLFAQAISDQGYLVREFKWNFYGLRRMDFVFLHWPDEFFVSRKRIEIPRSCAKLVVMWFAKTVWRTKFIWVAHNAKPHDPGNSKQFLRRWFLRSLDGIVYLSENSRKVIAELYPEAVKCRALVTVHGHYRGTAITQISPYSTPSRDVRLVQFGQIRRYKNVEVLVDAVCSISSGIRLLVAGTAVDRLLCAAIQAKSEQAAQIQLDFRDGPISDAELEAIIDAADAVVLPYKNVLNSGSALLALSRNRPVLAPRMGSLPELRDAVGMDWVYLYDGDFSRQVLLDFQKWLLATPRLGVAPLKAYEWDWIGNGLRNFIDLFGT